ncbi:C40 family peptidase [Sphingobacterium spiritivorum]|uniref:C40 family peptidase n=1 Tax=Sphingobacterium spiritivorum TaxID=258 RepID=UPI003DA5DEE9
MFSAVLQTIDIMAFGICNLSIVPLRAEAAHRSEMVSQLLFGECFEVLEETADWAYIKTDLDSYEGWLQLGQFAYVSIEEYSSHYSSKRLLVGLSGAYAVSGFVRIQLVHGTYVYTGQDNTMKIGAVNYNIEGDVFEPDTNSFGTEIAAISRAYEAVPYLWGGRSKAGIDCSGFSQLMYRHFNLQLPRDAYQQAEQGTIVDFLPEIKAGDLAYFDNAEGRITHVGIMLDSERIIHASAKIRIDKMDSEGIFNKDWNKYTHRLRIVKRYI